MKYIIMCGGTYLTFDAPRQLTPIDGEPIVARTIRLLRECGVDDIAISATDPVFEGFGVPVLRHENAFRVSPDHLFSTGHWSDGFYLMDEPVCYLFGDVVFSPEAIRTIVDYQTTGVMFFGSKRPFSDVYFKQYEEPYAFKVVDTNHFRKCVEYHKRLTDRGTHWRHPIAWELWFILEGKDPSTPTLLCNLKNDGYVGINDYTCDIDRPEDVKAIKEAMHAWTK